MDSPLLFWILSVLTVVMGLAVILLPNPIYCALFLAGTMISIAALFASLHAYFLAGVQLIVYAGAVMVLFVMVLMLFDLKVEVRAFSKGLFTGATKILMVGLVAGFIIGSIYLVSGALPQQIPQAVVEGAQGSEGAKTLGFLLYTDYILGFQILGILLLMTAIGAVALARSKGGTHDPR